MMAALKSQPISRRLRYKSQITQDGIFPINLVCYAPPSPTLLNYNPLRSSEFSQLFSKAEMILEIGSVETYPLRTRISHDFEQEFAHYHPILH